jgi:tripartite-type tricarboxylate transporter receptor subunit TctC
MTQAGFLGQISLARGGEHMRARRLATRLAAGAAMLSAAALGATALPGQARADDFYAGKTLTLIVGFAPGGGVDATARVVGRHLVRFIPGQPSLVVQNMEGAGGMAAINYLASRVASDGLTVAMPGRSWYVEGALKGPGVAFDIDKLTFIGSPGGANSGLYVRTATGVDSLAALKASAKPLTFGTLGATTPTAMVPALLMHHGYPIKLISGYVSTARILLALEQGEVDGFWTVEDSFARRHDLIDKNMVRPLLQTRPHLANVPVVSETMPASERPLLGLLEAPETVGVPLVGPPGIPAAHLDILRRAFLAMAADPDYQAEAAKAEQPVGAPIDGAMLAGMVGELAKAVTPDMVAAYRALAALK